MNLFSLVYTRTCSLQIFLLVLVNYSEHTQEFVSTISDKNWYNYLYLEAISLGSVEKLRCRYILIKYIELVFSLG